MKLVRVLLIVGSVVAVLGFVLNLLLVLYFYGHLGIYLGAKPSVSYGSALAEICCFFVLPLFWIVPLTTYCPQFARLKNAWKNIGIWIGGIITIALVLAGAIILTLNFYTGAVLFLVICFWLNALILLVQNKNNVPIVQPQSYNAMYAAMTRQRLRKLGFVLLNIAGLLLLVSLLLSCFHYVDQLLNSSQQQLGSRFFDQQFAHHLLEISLELCLPLAFIIAFCQAYKRIIKTADLPFLLVFGIGVLFGLWSLIGAVLQIDQDNSFGAIAIPATILSWIACLLLFIAHKEPDRDLDEALAPKFQAKTAINPSLTILPKRGHEPDPEKKLPNLEWTHS